MPQWFASGALVLLAFAVACGDDDESDAGAFGGAANQGGSNAARGGSEFSAGAGGGAGSNSGDAGAPAEAGLDAPIEREVLEAFLERGGYQDWPAEAAAHASSGPHGNSVRTFYSPRAAQAVLEESPTFPAGAATVKELFDGANLYGYSVWVKADADSDSGNNVYWYETANGGSPYEGLGARICTGCHSAGQDFLLSFLPFE